MAMPRSQSRTRVLRGGMECQCLARSRSSIRAKLSPLPETRIFDRDSALRQSNRMAKEKSVIPIERIAVKGGVNLDHFGGAKVDQLVKG